ncbi:MAG: hypothetical protein PHI35_02815 [Victivallaceae bacterium]|nr:hypothetical protein [Victivallaceae bacterium]
MKQQLKTTAWIAAAALAVSVAVVIGGYWRSFYLELTPNLSAVALTPADNVPLGGNAVAAIGMTLPLAASVDKIDVEPGDGAVAAGNPEVKFDSYNWSTRKITISQVLRPVKPGVIPPGKVFFTLARGDRRTTVDAEIPGFTAEEIPDLSAGEDLQLADAVALHKQFDRRYLYYTIPAAALAALLIWRLLRRRRTAAPAVPPWDRAMAELVELRGEVKEHNITAIGAFSRLSDVVRNYLEERFQLPASRRTTGEFLNSLDSAASPLPRGQRPFLREFLNTADLVKFAKVPPEPASLERAIESAETLVLVTRPEKTDTAEEHHA